MDVTINMGHSDRQPGDEFMRTFLGRIAVALLGGLFLATNVAAETPKRGGTLIWAIQGTPRHLNPAVQSGIATGQPGTQLFAAPL